LLKNSSHIEKNAYLWSKSAKKRNVRHVILPIYENGGLMSISFMLIF
jgi:hypothetical protein